MSRENTYRLLACLGVVWDRGFGNDFGQVSVACRPGNTFRA
jgi:hypothetical protein